MGGGANLKGGGGGLGLLSPMTLKLCERAVGLRGGTLGLVGGSAGREGGAVGLTGPEDR